MHNHIYLYNGVLYKRTKKDAAIRQITANHALRFFLVGSNVNDRHFHTGWNLATFEMTINQLNERYGKDNSHLETLYNEMCFHLEPELGRYPVFYVEQLGGNFFANNKKLRGL